MPRRGHTPGLLLCVCHVLLAALLPPAEALLGSGSGVTPPQRRAGPRIPPNYVKKTEQPAASETPADTPEAQTLQFPAPEEEDPIQVRGGKEVLMSPVLLEDFVNDCHKLDDCGKHHVPLVLDVDNIFHTTDNMKHCSPGIGDSEAFRAELEEHVQGLEAVVGHPVGVSIEKAEQMIEAYGHPRKLAKRTVMNKDGSPRNLRDVYKELVGGYCIMHDHRLSDLVKERVGQREWKTYNTDTLEQDAVLFMFESFLESKEMFTKQAWLGVQMQQFPIDAMAIQNIIWELRPQVIVETGTNNGGSALFFASMLELMGIEGAKVVTVDVNTPEKNFIEEFTRGNPLENPLWDKRVQFIQGLSTDRKVLRAIGQEVAAAQEAGAHVLVILDSDHKMDIVTQELEAYHGFVTPGSYMIVEDTRLDRMWHKDFRGPMAAVKAWVPTHPEFEIDRSREEMVFTQHPSGYLKRLN